MIARSSRKLLALTTLALMATVLLTAATRRPSGRPSPTDSAAWQRAEVARIQAHIAGAESLVTAGDLSRWSPAQRAARAHNLVLLRGYRERGVFPRNIDFPGRREPYFVDDRGVLCAMAFLVAASGRHDIVDRIRASRNNARIRELADDTALVAWLDTAGLTVDEAARIQPGYTCGCAIYSAPATEISTPILVGGLALSTIGVALNVPVNAISTPRRWKGTVGVIAGLLGLGAGLAIAKSDPGGTASTLTNVTIGASALSIGLGIYTAAVRVDAQAAPATAGALAAATPSPSHREPLLTLTPMVGARNGVRFHLSF